MSVKGFHGFNVHQILAMHTSFDVLGFSRSQGHQKFKTKLQVVFSVSWCVLSGSTFKLYLIAQYIEKIIPMELALCDVGMYFKGNNWCFWTRQNCECWLFVAVKFCKICLTIIAAKLYTFLPVSGIFIQSQWCLSHDGKVPVQSSLSIVHLLQNYIYR